MLYEYITMHGVKHIKLSLACINRIGTCFEKSSALRSIITVFTISQICKSFTSLVFLIAANPYDNISTRTIFSDSLSFPHKHVYSLHKLEGELFCCAAVNDDPPHTQSAHNTYVLNTQTKMFRSIAVSDGSKMSLM